MPARPHMPLHASPPCRLAASGLCRCKAKQLLRALAAQVTRYTLMNSTTGEIEVKTLSKEQEQDTSNFKDAESTADLEVQEKTALLEWLANTYKNYGCQLEFVTNRCALCSPTQPPLVVNLPQSYLVGTVLWACMHAHLEELPVRHGGPRLPSRRSMVLQWCRLCWYRCNC